MDNWGGARWTYKRKPRKFMGKSNKITGDLIGKDSWTFTVGRHTSETRISKEERQKRKHWKWIIFTLVAIPVFTGCVFLFIQVRSSFISYGKKQIEIQRVNTAYLEENKKAYNLAISYGENALKNGDYEIAVKEFEHALELGERTTELRDKLILACVLSCEKLKTNCKKIEKYDKLILD